MAAERGRARRLTDEEIADQRRIRFGELPARPAPEDLVETVDQQPSPEEPLPPMVRREWG